ncbi:MAG TPA: acyl-CoA dehydrogenase family protein, partial [Desulfobacterales bacterium]|nr:acyl-CoA dehydrogenase family protein [Desulfobacterales bacterium]
MSEPFLNPQHRLLRRTVRAFCEQELRPIASEIDQEARFPWEVAEKMGRLGYFGIQTPLELGGAGLDSMGYAVLIEEVSRVSAAIGLCLSVHNSVALYPILAFGSPDQHRRWVSDMAGGKKIGAFCLTEPNAGSDAGAVAATALAEEDGWRVNANKVFVTNGGIADICLIFARTDPAAGRKGISVVVAERGCKGFVVGELEDLCGMRANPVSSIRLYDCLVPRENLLGRPGQGLAIGLAALDTGRIGIAAQALGIAQAAFEHALAYAGEREQFGRSLTRFGAIREKLAGMAVRIAGARAHLLDVARRMDPEGGGGDSLTLPSSLRAGAA